MQKSMRLLHSIVATQRFSVINPRMSQQNDQANPPQIQMKRKRRIEAELHTEYEARAPSYPDPCGPPSF